MRTSQTAIKNKLVEAAKPIGVRLYERHRAMIKRLAKRMQKSEGEVVRIAIEDLYRRRG